jgi:hypothetical protein
MPWTSIGLVVIGLLAGSAGQAWAQGNGGFITPPATSGGGGRAVGAARGSGFITGNVGSLQTTTLPIRPGQGLLQNNGNGTSTLITPGGVPQIVATPR